MLKNVLSLGLPLAVIFFTSQAGSQNGLSTAPYDNGPSAYEMMLEDTIERVESCKSGTLDVYFISGYVEFHSAEVTHEALIQAKNCNVESLEVALIDTDSDASPISAVKTELIAILDAHELSELTNFQTLEREKTTKTLNGFSARIHFNLDTPKTNTQS